jgi:AbrB family looped-hinge helix DNA binding protein
VEVVKMRASTLSAKGLVVIPQELRRRHGLKQGDKLRFVDYGGVIAIIPASKDPIREARGMLKGETSLIEALQASRREDARKGK